MCWLNTNVEGDGDHFIAKPTNYVGQTGSVALNTENLRLNCY